MLFRKQHPRVGSRPGTLAIPPGSPRPRVRLVSYSPERVTETEVGSLAGLATRVQSEGQHWIIVEGLGDEGMLRQLGDELHIHLLALEDAVNVPQRAKSELYPDHQLVIARVPIAEGHELREVPQVCFFVGHRYLLTIEERAFGFLAPVLERLREGVGPMRRMGVDYLAYAALDTLVDGYYPIAERLSARLDDLEDEVVDEPGPEVLNEIHRVRRHVAVLRRVGWPQREAINAMMREATPFVTDEVRVFLRDTSDHIAQIIELLDSSREVATGLSEIYLSNVSQRTNEVMKVLTIMASLFIPLTFVAGIYGMNFEHMPELHARGGYYAVLVVMLVVAGGMLAYFWHRGWIGRKQRRPSKP